GIGALLTASASWSDCVRRLARSLRKLATDFSIPSSRAVTAGSVPGSFANFDSRPATRALRSSNAIGLTWAGAGGDCTSGQPRNEPTASTTAAATRPDNGATSQGEAPREPDPRGAGSACFGGSDEACEELAS